MRAVSTSTRTFPAPHLKDDGEETLSAGPNAAVVEAIRALVSQASISLTTRDGLAPSAKAKLEAIAKWTALPDLVTANQGEEDIAAVCELLISRGVGIEAGLLAVEDAEAFAGSGIAMRCVRVLLEPLDANADEAVEHAKEMETILERAEIDLPRVYHGDGIASWAVNRYGATRGHGVRTGIEDTPVLPDGRLARDNAELVRFARELLSPRH